jgi:hypothetical protein
MNNIGVGALAMVVLLGPVGCGQDQTPEDTKLPEQPTTNAQAPDETDTPVLARPEPVLSPAVTAQRQELTRELTSLVTRFDDFKSRAAEVSDHGLTVLTEQIDGRIDALRTGIGQLGSSASDAPGDADFTAMLQELRLMIKEAYDRLDGLQKPPSGGPDAGGPGAGGPGADGS